MSPVPARCGGWLGQVPFFLRLRSVLVVLESLW